MANTDLDAIIRLIPGYDPVATAGECRFDEAAARLALDFFEECLRHVKGKLRGQPFKLQPWQQAIVANIFGWKRPDGLRRYREALIYVPRKNGKTTLAAGIINYMLFVDREPGAEIYSAAADRDQARLVWDQVVGMVRQEPGLAANCRILRGYKCVERTDRSAVYRCISSEANTKHGFNTHCAVVDELHAHKSDELLDAIQTSTGAREQPLIIELTTADYARESVCNLKYDYACQVRDGIVADEAFLPVLYGALPDDDWTSPDVWAQANPNLGVSVGLDFLERECRRAQEQPVYENTFKRLHLNIQTQQAVRMIPMHHWDACPATASPETLRGLPCWAGLDLAKRNDTNALALFFPDRRAILAWFWVPGDNAPERERRDHVPYMTWEREGYMRFTPGNVADQERIFADVCRIARDYRVKALAIDRWGSQWMTTKLQGAGFDVVEFGQGFQSMSAPTKMFLNLVESHQLDHGGNPVLRWMASVCAGEDDAADNIKPSKKASTERIDGIVASIMAIGLAMADGFEMSTGSVYDTRGVVWI